MICPRDRKELLGHHTPKGLVYSCVKCSGIWMPGEIAESATGKKNISERLLKRPQTGSASLSCPDCYLPMKSVDLSPVEIDVCPTCKGIWLDEGEIQRLKSMSSNPLSASAVTPSLSGDVIGGIAEIVFEIVIQGIAGLLD